jgi:hypothetical protein
MTIQEQLNELRNSMKKENPVIDEFIDCIECEDAPSITLE